ncbi:MAG: acyltransferase family protein, partial [Actinomycetes bacterium]
MSDVSDPPESSGFGWGANSVRRDRGLLGASEMTHQPALDGLRAVAVLAVVLFHARFSWIPGGFLGVSTFFTLSGFLITSLLLREWSRRGGIGMRTFWRRRFRRLLPASWLTLGLVLGAGMLGVWSVDQQRSLRGDVPFSLAEIVNWHFIAAGRTYGAQFQAPSPLEHFWSLSVEQQFYVFLPLALLGVLTLSRLRSHRSPLRLVAGVMAVVVVVSTGLNWWFARSSLDRAYFGTDTRAAELAAGALLACVCVRSFRVRHRRARRAIEVAGIVGLLISAALWATVSVSTRWMYPWGFLLTAASSSALIFGALQGGV